jgi:hypothetical protein
VITVPNTFIATVDVISQAGQNRFLLTQTHRPAIWTCHLRRVPSVRRQGRSSQSISIIIRTEEIEYVSDAIKAFLQ